MHIIIFLSMKEEEEEEEEVLSLGWGTPDSGPMNRLKSSFSHHLALLQKREFKIRLDVVSTLAAHGSP